MRSKYRNQLTLAAALAFSVLATLALNGCSGRNPAELPVAKAAADPVVFDDAFGANLDYSAFEYSYYEAMTIEQSGGYEDSPTLLITIPGGNWAGGSYWTHVPRDLSSFNALTLWTRASQSLDLAECGIGIGIVAPETYKVGMTNTSLTGSWQQLVIPIPNPDRLTAESGMFWFSHGTGGVEIWFDEIIFANVPNINNPRPVMDSASVEALLGETVPISGTMTTFNVNGEDVEVSHTPAYFDYASSDDAVAVAADGAVMAVGGGTATITAKLGDTDVDGEVTVTVIAPPTTPAPTPTPVEADVISIFSDAYANNTTVDSWRTDWSSGSVAVYDQQIEGDNVKAYVGLNNMAYVGIDYSGDQIDATAAEMTHFSLDVFAPTGAMLVVKLIDFGPDGAYGGGDDTEKALTLHGGSTPPFTSGQWVTLDIPLTDFTDMNFGNLSQLVLQSTNIGNVWVDNIYFHK